jgi:hypothetical protein
VEFIFFLLLGLVFSQKIWDRDLLRPISFERGGEAEKGVEVGKLPRKFLSLAESFGTKPTHFLRA